MSLADAAYALDELAGGRVSDQTRAMRGLAALHTLPLQDRCEPALRDAAATLELFVATGGMVSTFAEARARAKSMAAAVRRVIARG